MTPARTGLFLHLGGPYDGERMPVEVDENDVPVEFNMATDFTEPNLAIPSFAGIQSSLIKNTYERDERLGDNGFEYVFKYVGTDTIDQNQQVA